jgi:hypothetical protein
MLEIKHEHSNDNVGFINAKEFLHSETLLSSQEGLCPHGIN